MRCDLCVLLWNEPQPTVLREPNNSKNRSLQYIIVVTDGTYRHFQSKIPFWNKVLGNWISRAVSHGCGNLVSTSISCGWFAHIAEKLEPQCFFSHAFKCARRTFVPLPVQTNKNDNVMNSMWRFSICSADINITPDCLPGFKTCIHFYVVISKHPTCHSQICQGKIDPSRAAQFQLDLQAKDLGLTP